MTSKELPGPLKLKRGYIRTKEPLPREQLKLRSLKLDGWGQNVKHIAGKTYYEPKEYYYINKELVPRRRVVRKLKPKRQHVHHKKKSSWW
jgi:hypothetical protein